MGRVTDSCSPRTPGTSCPAQAPTVHPEINKTPLCLLGTPREDWKSTLWCPRFLLRTSKPQTSVPHPWAVIFCTTLSTGKAETSTTSEQACSWESGNAEILSGAEFCAALQGAGSWTRWSPWVPSNSKQDSEHQRGQNYGRLVHLDIRFYWWTWSPNSSPTHLQSSHSRNVPPFSCLFPQGKEVFSKNRFDLAHHTRVAHNTHPNTTSYGACKTSWI